MSEVVAKTEQYYDSRDADEFYYQVWGGEDIHIGMYHRREESIFEASRRTVERMSARLEDFVAGSTVVDIGSGYGGAARYLAREKGYRVHCLNLSRVQNTRNRQMNDEQTLSVLIDVVDGNFEDMPFNDRLADIVWSQDAILHSGDRFQVFREVDRILKPGGRFVFTDPMQKGGVSREALQPVLDRIHLDTMGSVADYDSYAEKLGWEKTGFDDHSDQLPIHYQAVLSNLEQREEELAGMINAEYIASMKRGLRHWIDAGNAGLLTWGILGYQKAKG